ncbi:MAG: hypothetical protein K5905_19935 [Roseibium sp.]|uniref:hypothetical protein n=1 Tax=Roseibium sp. TaxID=1936156 RepID=UPI00260BFADE|nr:hypothetical protein [Roseibium sp.]MCV0427733.1 hypothetical protein [Roseibium sp.]
MISLSSYRSIPRTAKARAQLLSLSTALALVSGSAFAEDTGLAAFNAYVEGLKKLGLQVENGAIDYDTGSDTLTVTDSKLTFSGTFTESPEEKPDATGNDDATTSTPADLKQLDYLISMVSGTVTITGLTHDNNEFSAASWTYSDDTELLVTGEAKGAGRLKIDGRLAGTLATNYSFTMPEIPAEDPDHQVSRWLPFVKATLLTSYDEVKVDSTGLTIEAYETSGDQETLVLSGTMQLDGYRIANAADGRVGEYSIDSMTQNLQTLDISSGGMLSQTTSQGKTIYQDMDIAAFIDLFDPAVPESSEERTLVGSVSAVDYTSSQEIAPGVPLQIDVEKVTGTNFTILKRENSLLSLLDDLLSAQEPAPEELITNLFQLYRSFAMEDARMSGIKVTVPPIVSPEESTVSIKEVALSDISSDGIGEMMMVGLDAPNLPEGASVKLDWAAIRDIEFAEYEPMRAMIDTLVADPSFGENHPLEVARAFMPRSFGYEVESLLVNVPDVGLTQIGQAEMSVSTTVPPVPTSFFVRNDGIRIPVKAIEDAEVQALLQELGLEEVVWSDETRFYWDEATLELRLERLMLEIEGLGMAEASARFANVPKELFEDPEGQGQMAAIVAQFVDASFVFRDAGLTTKGLKHVAEAQGIPENVFREVLVSQAVDATAPIGNEAFTKMVQDAATKFLNNPKELKVTIAPANPVPLAQILGSMAAPQTLPDLLNIKVEAN